MGMITWICFLKMRRPVVQDTASACTQIRPASLGKEGLGEPERTQCDELDPDFGLNVLLEMGFGEQSGPRNSFRFLMESCLGL